jgi:apolipoprotein N-acyltransferase
MLPAHGRRLAQAGATLFFNPSNDYWFGSESAARLQLTAARFRAIENRREVIRATSTGYSAFIDAAGRLVALSDFGDADLLTGRVGASGIVTVYRRVGDAAAWLCVAFALLSSPLRRTWQE